MSNNLKNSILFKAPLKFNNKVHLSGIMILAPLMNFLVGLLTDLYAPSMPAMVSYFHTDPMLVKNTISSCILGFAIGCIIFGTLVDMIGRRPSILITSFLFVIVTTAALFCTNINQLLWVRFFQGICCSSYGIASRSLIADYFTGKGFLSGMIYTSAAFAVGPIIAPYLGSLIQVHFGWKANFIAYIILTIMVVIPFMLIVNEPCRPPPQLSNTLKSYGLMLKHHLFLTGIIISGTVSIELFIFPTLGPFIIEHDLHKSAIVYGHNALIIGLGYLCGTFANRLLIVRFSSKQIIFAGLIIFLICVIAQFICIYTTALTIAYLILPLLGICFSGGLVYPNIIATLLKIFPNNRSVSLAIQACLLMLMTSLSTFIMSLFNINTLFYITLITSTILVLQGLPFLLVFHKITE